MFACGSIRFGGCICDNGPDSGNNCEKHIHNSWQLCLFSISVLIKNNASCWRQRKQMKEKNANSLISERKLNCVCCFHYAVPFQLALLFCFSFLTSVFFFSYFFIIHIAQQMNEFTHISFRKEKTEQNHISIQVSRANITISFLWLIKMEYHIRLSFRLLSTWKFWAIVTSVEILWIYFFFATVHGRNHHYICAFFYCKFWFFLDNDHENALNHDLRAAINFILFMQNAAFATIMQLYVGTCVHMIAPGRIMFRLTLNHKYKVILIINVSTCEIICEASRTEHNWRKRKKEPWWNLTVCFFFHT